MQKKDVVVGGVYFAKVSGQRVRVRIDAPHPNTGWNATNLETGRLIRIRTAARLRGRAGITGWQHSQHQTPHVRPRGAIVVQRESDVASTLQTPQIAFWGVWQAV